MLLSAALLAAIPAEAREDRRPTSISITVDTSIAEHTLSLVCSQREVNERQIRSSPLVQAQIEHNRGLVAAATMDAYVEGLRALSACRAPSEGEDVFRVGAILADPELFRRKVDGLRARQSELASSVADRLTSYVPAGTQFQRAVILAVPYFSCGGFERGEYFYIDVQCLAADIDDDFAALEVLVAHETFHALQARTFFPAPIDAGEIGDVNTGLQYHFGTMLREGTATYVAGTSALLDVPSAGAFTRLGQSFGRENAARLGENFRLLTILFGYAAASPVGQERARAEAVEDLAFDGGSFQEFGYYVGARIAADIEQVWGREALVCVMQLPPEQFILAHEAAVAAEELRLGAEAIDAARSVALARSGVHGFERCHPTLGGDRQ